MHQTPASESVILELITYDKVCYDHHSDHNPEILFDNLKPGLCNWLNLDGLKNPGIIEKIQQKFNLHMLLVDDVLSDQRPKVEEYDDYLFITCKMLYRIEEREIDYEQISFVLGKDFLISFQEKEGDLFNSFRDRIRLDQGRVRKKGVDYLLYRLLDIILDNYYNVLDKVGELVDEIEEVVYENPSARTFNRIQGLKKELIFLRKALFPLREALGKVVKAETDFIQDENERFFSDLYDHAVHLIDSVDTYKDLISNLVDIHINSMNTRMNEVMKVLTVISTIFMPLTFIVGVYGMNFKVMPELQWSFGYYLVWGIMIAITIGMMIYFRFKKWF